ncbi:class I adenylate-forming enzyme family protein [Acetobacterium wieringae]|uniref:class I adenylate-forming enzyme family protein n=1 Tax=Acetobacterium wieringae TaxID=52694 RepID=UPI0026F0A1F1|nr:AMP-binding protein [Acetobacterium wieringae]
MNNMMSVPDFAFYRARTSGRREAVFDYDNKRSYTYAEIEKRSNCLAFFLLEELGLRKGDRIAFCAENSIAFIDAFFMSCKTGIILTSYNYMLGRNELNILLEKETPRVVFYSNNCKQAVENLRQDGVKREYIPINGDRDDRDQYSYSDITTYESNGTAVFDTPRYDEIQMLIHTGGTTGDPKAAMMSYWALFFNAMGEILTAGINRYDCINVMLPFFHTAGWNVLMLPTLIAGGRVIITEKFEPGKILKIIETERPTACLGIETMYRAISSHPDFEKADFSCYRWMLNGAAPISRETLNAYWNKGVKMVNAYGMTEVGPNNLSPAVNDMTPEEIKEKWISVGRPMYFNNIRLVNEDGVDVQDGEKGELLFSGNLTFSGYWKDVEKTNEIVKDGWIHTGDIAYKDQDGYYYICGRKKNMFISGGENIYPIEIEHTIMGHPSIECVCVLGVPDERWGEVGKAVVVLKPEKSVTKEELQAHIRKEKSRIKTPKYIQFIESIPKTSVGKVDLARVRQIYGYPADV